jgi:hypothetical protein
VTLLILNFILSNLADQADLLRRELDNRFLDRTLQQPVTVPPPAPSLHSSSSNTTSVNQTSSQSTPPVIPPVHTPTSTSAQSQQQSTVPFLRQELHHHQHQHTHLHQHQHQHQSLLPSTPSGTLFPPPLFKDIPKIGAVDSPFYRTAPALVPGIPYYPSGMLHQGMSGPTPFVPPAHLQSFTPKVNINFKAFNFLIVVRDYEKKQNYHHHFYVASQTVIISHIIIPKKIFKN